MVARVNSLLYYGWVIVALSFLNMALAAVVRYSFSVFFVPILDEFGWSRADTAAAFSLSMVAYGFASPVVGTLIDRHDTRKVMPLGSVFLAANLGLAGLINNQLTFYLAVGALAFGMGFLWYVPLQTVIPNWFVQRRGTAVGFGIAGVGLGYIGVFLVGLLVTTIGWRESYWVMAAVILLVAVPSNALFYYRRPQDVGLQAYGVAAQKHSKNRPAAEALVVDPAWASRDWTLGASLRTLRFWFTFLLIVGQGIHFNLIIVHLVAYVRDVGFSEVLGASVISLLGFATVLGNFGGVLSDRYGREKAFTLSASIGIFSIGLLVLAGQFQMVPLFFVFALLYGISNGIGSPTVTVMMADIFQGKYLGIVSGFLTMGYGLGGALGPWVGGLIFDVSKSYTGAFGFAMGALGLAIVTIWLAAPRKVRLTSLRQMKRDLGSTIAIVEEPPL